jgi:hypothetical protein
VGVSETFDAVIGVRAMPVSSTPQLMLTSAPLMFTCPVADASMLVCAWILTSVVDVISNPDRRDLYLAGL